MRTCVLLRVHQRVVVATTDVSRRSQLDHAEPVTAGSAHPTQSVVPSVHRVRQRHVRMHGDRQTGSTGVSSAGNYAHMLIQRPVRQSFGMVKRTVGVAKKIVLWSYWVM